jgi:tRNA (Uracil-5-)-methyltransferase
MHLCAYRCRAEFRVWKEGEDAYYIMFERGEREAEAGPQPATASEAAPAGGADGAQAGAAHGRAAVNGEETVRSAEPPGGKRMRAAEQEGAAVSDAEPSGRPADGAAPLGARAAEEPSAAPSDAAGWVHRGRCPGVGRRLGNLGSAL